jgi:SWI/SNF-related matrix-associated actin-dependent regulator 1 of chromatin subfamily A
MSTTLHTKPFPYQLEAVERIEAFDGRALLAAEMGTGKTLISLLYLVRHPELRPAVVVCPASIKWGWEREAKHHVGMYAVVLEGTRPKSLQVRDDSPLYIVNYDVLSSIERKVKGRIYKAPGWARWLRKLKPKVVIFDECHFLGSVNAKRTQSCRYLCHGPVPDEDDERAFYRVPHILALSGTPLVNRPFELWPTLHILQPEKFGNMYSFGHRFCDPKRGFAGRWEFKGASNIPKLNRVLTKHGGMIRYLKKDVIDQLPPKRRTVLPMDIDNRPEYDKAVANFAKWIAEKYGVSRARRALAAERVTKLGYLKRLAAAGKMNRVIEWIDDFLAASDEKLIVFAVHRSFIDALMEKYRQTAVKVDGSVTGRKRQNNIDAFVNNKRFRLFIGQIKAAGVGWNAKGCSTVLFAEMGWSPGTHTQAEDRCHGLNRGKAGVKMQAIYAVAKDTVEDVLARILQRKQKWLSETLDGEGKGDDLNLFDLLTKELTRNT